MGRRGQRTNCVQQREVLQALQAGATRRSKKLRHGWRCSNNRTPSDRLLEQAVCMLRLLGCPTHTHAPPLLKPQTSHPWCMKLPVGDQNHRTPVVRSFLQPGQSLCLPGGNHSSKPRLVCCSYCRCCSCCADIDGGRNSQEHFLRPVEARFCPIRNSVVTSDCGQTEQCEDS